MGYFNRDSGNRGGRDNRGGGRGFGGGRDRGGRGDRPSFRDDVPREMFKTVCSNCGKDCEVPFKPTSGKPVYCSDCFEKMGGRNSDVRSERPERNRSDFSNRPHAPVIDNSKQLEELNKKLDKIIELLTPKTEVVAVAEPVVEKEKVVKAPKVKKAKEVVEE